MNPTYRPNQRPSQQPVEPARAGWSCRLSCVWVCSYVPSGKFGLAKEFLAANLEPREVPLAFQLANKTKERGSVLAQIERERVLVSDLTSKYEKHTETLTQLMERKYSLQRESEELESLSAAAEAKQQGVPVEPLAPGPPQTPQPVGLREVFPGPPPLIEQVTQDEEGDDEAVEPGDLIPGAGVGFYQADQT